MRKRTNYCHVLCILFLIFLFLAVIGIIPESAFSQEIPFFDPDKTVSMDLQDASLKDILKIFSLQADLNFIATQGAESKRVSLYLNNVTIKDAMDKLFLANNLVYEIDKKSNIILIKDSGLTKQNLITKIFPLKYASVSNSLLTKAGGGGAESALMNAITNLLSADGKVTEDSRTNSIIVTDLPMNIPNIAKLISEIDIVQPQILLEVEMLDVNKSLTDSLGLKYSQTPVSLSSTITPAALATAFPYGKVIDWFKGENVASSKGSIAFGTSQYSITFDFLKTFADTKSLARPKILTLNNQSAEINITTDEVVSVQREVDSESGDETYTAERIETGVKLTVTPQVNMETGEITMYIEPQVAARGAVYGKSDADYPIYSPEKRSTKSRIRVYDGETIVMGGLIREDLTETVTKLPFLGDIPMVGALFRHRSTNPDQQRELLVFITPHIIESTPQRSGSLNMSVLDREQSPSDSERAMLIQSNLQRMK